MHASITVKFKDPVEPGTTDVGSLHVKHPSGRETTLDTYRSHISEEGDCLCLGAAEDRETFPDCSYDLTPEDARSGELSATLFVSSETGNTVESISYQLEDVHGSPLSDDLQADEEV